MYHENITEDHLNACDFHVNNYRYATGFLAKNFRSSSPAIWHENDSLINIFKLKYRKPKFTIENVNLPLSHSMHPPFVSAGMTVGEGGRGWASDLIFKRGKLLGKRGVAAFT